MNKTIPTTVAGTIKKYAGIRDQISALEKVKKALAARLIETAGENETNRLEGYGEQYAVVCETSRETCSVSKLRDQYPDIYRLLRDAGVVKESASKSVRVYK